MVLLVLLGLSMAAGGGLAFVLSLAVLLFVGKGGSAPSHSPPRSEVDAESEAGATDGMPEAEELPQCSVTSDACGTGKRWEI